MKILRTVAGIKSFLAENSPKTIGLVPTMGALHQGHLSLIEKAKLSNDLVIVSIFVNPLQFGVNEDFNKYPRQLEIDSELCALAGVDVIFAPTPETIGIRDNLTTVVPPETLTDCLCGKTRIGHFTGVATIVTKLFNIIQPTNAYFGEKDGQQLVIIENLVKDLHLSVNIIRCPIVREESGLALSSRNQYLTAEERSIASNIYQSLNLANKRFKSGERDSKILIDIVQQQLHKTPELIPEYIEIVSDDRLEPINTISDRALLAIAVKLGKTRLIDNMTLSQILPVIAIDGPAGAGKSTVTKQLAANLGLLFLDTGAMYRAVTWLVLESKIGLDDITAIAELVDKAEINLTQEQVFINRQDVTSVIRQTHVTSNVSQIAAIPCVRQALVKQQQAIGAKGGIVAEGRDMCTHVFPNAEIKIFLTATVQERAKRRQQDLINLGQPVIDLLELEESIAKRDYLDSNRAIAPLKKAPDALEIITDNLTIDQVVERITKEYLKVVNQQV